MQTPPGAGKTFPPGEKTFSSTKLDFFSQPDTISGVEFRLSTHGTPYPAAKSVSPQMNTKTRRGNRSQLRSSARTIAENTPQLPSWRRRTRRIGGAFTLRNGSQPATAPSNPEKIVALAPPSREELTSLPFDGVPEPS